MLLMLRVLVYDNAYILLEDNWSIEIITSKKTIHGVNESFVLSTTI